MGKKSFQISTFVSEKHCFYNNGSVPTVRETTVNS